MQQKPSIEEYLNYIGAAVPAHGAGWRKMKCPFHDDSHASAAVNYDGGAFICHGCGIKGDVYKLIQHKEGVNYREAIKFAETILVTSDTTVRKQDRNSRRVSRSTESIGRRSKNFSLGRSRRTIT